KLSSIPCVALRLAQACPQPQFAGGGPGVPARLDPSASLRAGSRDTRPSTVRLGTMNEIHGIQADGKRSARAGVADRKGHHHTGVLSALAERAGECLQPEVE